LRGSPSVPSPEPHARLRRFALLLGRHPYPQAAAPNGIAGAWPYHESQVFLSLFGPSRPPARSSRSGPWLCPPFPASCPFRAYHASAHSGCRPARPIRQCLLSGFCSSIRGFATRFFQRSLTVAALRFAWIATTDSPGDSHAQVTSHSGHTGKGARNPWVPRPSSAGPEPASVRATHDRCVNPPEDRR
jgi:hypothetical protein